MSDKIDPCRLRFKKLAVGVCVVATALSGFLGALASFLYAGLGGRSGGIAEQVGAGFGAVAGLLAGVIWCRRMWRRIQNGEVARLSIKGTWEGLKVGVLATLLLHAGIIITGLLTSIFGQPNSDWLSNPLGGLFFGIPAGLFLGAHYGSTCQAKFKDMAKEQTTIDQGEEPQAS